MTAVITGDVINSRKIQNDAWLKSLKEVLSYYGWEPVNWQVYRGDSFQMEIEPSRALLAAIHIKSAIKKFKQLDVRMGIGIGDKTVDSNNITEANGSAFIHSGECFENLKKSTLAIKSPWPELDEEINLNISLALLTMDRWAGNTSGIVKEAIENPDLTQQELASKINKTQSTISESLKRAGFDEILRFEKKYRMLIKRI